MWTPRKQQRKRGSSSLPLLNLSLRFLIVKRKLALQLFLLVEHFPLLWSFVSFTAGVLSGFVNVPAAAGLRAFPHCEPCSKTCCTNRWEDCAQSQSVMHCMSQLSRHSTASEGMPPHSQNTVESNPCTQSLPEYVELRSTARAAKSADWPARRGVGGRASPGC